MGEVEEVGGKLEGWWEGGWRRMEGREVEEDGRERGGGGWREGGRS